MSILSRNGAKPKYIVREIEKHFPPKYDFYFEPFFGAGGMYFQKEYMSKYSFLNDLDKNVYLFFNVLKNEPQRLIDAITIIPNHESLFYDFLDSDYKFKDDVERAAAFWFVNSRSFLGKGDMFHCVAYGNVNIEKQINHDFKKMFSGCTLTCCDFRLFFSNIHLHTDIKRSFVYADPPYLGCDNQAYYGTKWKHSDFLDLLNCLDAFGSKFILSENGKNENVMNEAKKRGYFYKEIYTRQQRGKERIETIFANYQLDHDMFELCEE